MQQALPEGQPRVTFQLISILHVMSRTRNKFVREGKQFFFFFSYVRGRKFVKMLNGLCCCCWRFNYTKRAEIYGLFVTLKVIWGRKLKFYWIFYSLEQENLNLDFVQNFYLFTFWNLAFLMFEIFQIYVLKGLALKFWFKIEKNLQNFGQN